MINDVLEQLAYLKLKSATISIFKIKICLHLFKRITH